MLYTVGAIVGAASTGPVWSRLGTRRGYTLGAAVFALGTLLCALAPDMASLVAARGVQGWAGGLVSGGGTALVTSLFDARLRTRILAMSQATFTACHLTGPVVGGLFATIHWWRGSFWVMVPFMLGFAGLVWAKLPHDMGLDARHARSAPFPILRLATLASGVFCIAATGPVEDLAGRLALIAVAVALVAVAFRFDRDAANPLFPSRTLSLNAPIGLALWILFLHGMAQTTVTLFLPLLLQVVHGVSPLFVNVVTIVVSCGWTAATFTVSGWSGAKERAALAAGPLLTVVALAVLVAVAPSAGLERLALAAFLLGFGTGLYNVHLIAEAMRRVSEREHRATAAALSSVRALGTAFGAAIGGVIAHGAGLGDATSAPAVSDAVTAVYISCCVPLALTVVFMTRFMRIAFYRHRAPEG
jgi:MFS family permease